MRKISTLLLAMMAFGVSFGQNKQVASPARAGKIATYDVKAKQLARGFETEATPVNKMRDLPAPSTQNPSALSVVDLGRASNSFSILRQEQNQVWANNATNMVAFIHRQDVTIFGGGTSANGKLRYDLSIDGGWSFTKDIGVLNSTYTRPARYPNMCGVASGVDPLASNLAWIAPTLDPSPAWDGNVNGYSNVNTSSVTSTEHYDFIGGNTLLAGGLCQGAANTLWAVDHEVNATSTAQTVLDSLFTLKGTIASGDVTWAKTATKIPHEKTIQDGNGTAAVRLVGPNVAASPSGNDVWVGWLGDLIGGIDSGYTPCYMHSTDGGTTWSSPMEVDLRTISWIADTLQSFWIVVDSVTGDTSPAGSGIPTTAFDWDMTVDANGNPHFFAVIGNRPSGTAYSISSGLVMFAADITTTNGGTSWSVNYVAPVMTLRGEFGTPAPDDGSLLTLDNWCQVSRTEDGSHIFYSWTDTDTSIVGFGTSDNTIPNLRISGLRLSDRFRTCWKKVTDGDVVWDGKIYAPTMAPTVLSNANIFRLPIVFLNMLNNDQLAATRFEYLGGDAYFLPSEFVDPATINLQADGSCNVAWVGVPKPFGQNGVILDQSYPNPTTGSADIRFEVPANMEVEMNLFNLFGQQVATLYKGTATAGEHTVTVDASNLHTGIYIYTLNAGGKEITRKMVVSH